MFTARAVAKDELPVIRTLALATWPSAYGGILSAEQLEYMLELIYNVTSLQQQMENGHRFYFALQNEKPAGFASFSSCAPNRYRLHKLYVLPELQGKGAGQFLLELAIHEAKRAGANYLELNVNRYNKAQGFYKRNGFTVVREEDIDIGKGYFMNDYIMELAL